MIVTLLLVIYGCESWILTLWEEHTLSLFENREQRENKIGKICGMNEEKRNVCRLLLEN
jgi:hypothetical protein